MGKCCERIKKFDFYPEFDEALGRMNPTKSGRVVSFFCLVAMIYLFCTEFARYLIVKTKSEMLVDSTPDTGNQHAMMQINMNITMPQIPCPVISVDAQDVMGSHVVDVGGKLHKTRVNKDGVMVGEFQEETPLDQMIGEGCNINGNMIVKRVPGNFHVSAHAHANLVHVFFKNQPMNVSHIIHDLSFGETDVLNTVESAHVNPLRGAQKIADLPGNNPSNAKSYEYYIKIVPTNFLKLSGEFYESFQFVANSNEIVGRYRLPAVYFRYDMSPITVLYSETKQTLSHFIVQLCAIVGGVFTVLGLFNSVVNTSMRVMLQKAQINKLG